MQKPQSGECRPRAGVAQRVSAQRSSPAWRFLANGSDGIAGTLGMLQSCKLFLQGH